ncbi:MAG: hypothetical protein ABOK23_04425 [Candidatus Methanoperedens sp.]|nr:hypothetical protein [Candidatus Methanoperedens sp.]MCZ7394501.1 hypothetical protein [Candidatus Methanoperedens sp.]
MAFIWDPITAVNLVLSVIILVLGYWGYKKSNDKVPLYVGVAFGLFGVSHLATLLGLAQRIVSMLIIIRTLAYLIVIFAVNKIAFKR